MGVNMFTVAPSSCEEEIRQTSAIDMNSDPSHCIHPNPTTHDLERAETNLELTYLSRVSDNQVAPLLQC
jgi:hypothetical protein